MHFKKQLAGISVFILIVTVITIEPANAGVSKFRFAPKLTVRQWMTKNPPDINALGGRIYVVDFWATWCGPCIKGIGELNEINQKYKKYGLVFLSLCQDKSPEKIDKIIGKKNVNFHVAIDNGTVDGFAVSSYPTVAVVNHQGKIVWQGRPWDSNFEKAIRNALDAGPPPLLRDVNLGPFRHHWKSLFGGKKFAAAYSDIKSFAASDIKDKNKSKYARSIIETIDRRIGEQLKKAEYYRKSDPMLAYDIYRDVFSKYDGIDVVKLSAADFIKLQKALGMEQPLSGWLKNAAD